jgi:DNA mismatch repair ATPase MutS
LKEKCGSFGPFVPNSVRSGCSSTAGEYEPHGSAKVHILTGPNASGKSVLLKQVGLIVYLAHVGCYVPAEAARISMVDGIFSRIKCSESLSSGLSSFMAEATQMAYALNNSTGSSLVSQIDSHRHTLKNESYFAISLNYK